MVLNHRLILEAFNNKLCVCSCGSYLSWDSLYFGIIIFTSSLSVGIKYHNCLFKKPHRNCITWKHPCNLFCYISTIILTRVLMIFFTYSTKVKTPGFLQDRKTFPRRTFMFADILGLILSLKICYGGFTFRYLCCVPLHQRRTPNQDGEDD